MFETIDTQYFFKDGSSWLCTSFTRTRRLLKRRRRYRTTVSEKSLHSLHLLKFPRIGPQKREVEIKSEVPYGGLFVASHPKKSLKKMPKEVGSRSGSPRRSSSRHRRSRSNSESPPRTRACSRSPVCLPIGIAFQFACCHDWFPIKAQPYSTFRNVTSTYSDVYISTL